MTMRESFPMSGLPKEEAKKLEGIFSDLELVSKKEKIELSEIDELEEKLESKEVINYLKDLRSKSKPETALREELMAGSSLLSKFFFGKTSPEVSTSEGFIDYKIEDGLPMLLELKPIFTPKRDKEGNLQYLQQKKLDWRDYQDQIEKYRTENEFLILTNLKTWFFFSRRSPEPIHSEPIDLKDFFEDFSRKADLRNYLERLESRSIKGDLDKRFFESLKTWVSILEKIDFDEDISEDEKIELIVKLINKFIFIQTLDDHSIVDFQWIRSTWQDKVRRWQNIGKERVLKEFFNEVNEWFYAYYDTELFRGNILNYVSKDEKNIEAFYSNLKKVLGLEHWQRAVGERGIINYNFRDIDEDIFGKAYETFLVEVRKEQGIYYTPKYVTQYIVENTVGKKFDSKIDEFKKALDNKNFDDAEKLLQDITEVRVLDPACGSGSFLIKALRVIWEKYQEIISLLKEVRNEHQNFKGTLDMSEEDEETLDGISKLEDILNYSDSRNLISKIILRHIHGNDLDKRALDVAKLNIWLEAIKIVPKQFRYDEIPNGEGYVLPDLEMNLGHGDSLVGLTEEEIINILEENYSEEILALSEIRNSYLGDPTDEELLNELVKKREKIKSKINDKFYSEFDDDELINKIKAKKPPFYWPLHFWFAYQNGAGKLDSDSGFDIVIGNPPYYTEARKHKEDFRIYKKSPPISQYYEPKMDVFYYFIEKGLDLLKKNGFLGYIVLRYWNQRTYAEKLNAKIAHESQLEELVDFHGYKVFEKAKGIHSETLILQKQSESKKPIEEYQVPVIDILDKDLAVDDVREGLLEKGLPSGMSQTEKKVVFRESSNRIGFVEAKKEDIIDRIENNSNFELEEDNITNGLQTYIDKVTTSIIEELDENNIDHDFEENEGVFVLSKEELSDLDLNKEEQELIKPFYWAKQVEPFYLDKDKNEYLIYTEKSFIDYDGRGIGTEFG